MAVIDTLEGSVNSALWYHYDVSADVLYLKLTSQRDTQTIGEETDDGLILLRSRDTRTPVGMTVVNWWKRFGRGALPDSINEFHRQIEPWAAKLAA